MPTKTMVRKVEEISAGETMIELGLEPSYVYKLMRTGRIRGRKVNGRWRVNAEDVRTRARVLRERKEWARARSERNIRPNGQEQRAG